MRAWLMAAVTVCSGCGTPPPEQKSYQLVGQILAVRPETREVLLRHGDVVGFMPAMTMPFKVKDASVLAQRVAGDLVTATLVVTDTESWVSAITRTGSAPLPDDAPTKIPAAAGVHILQPGDEVPDTTLTDAQEQPFRLTDWRGSVVAVTFIYASCPLPEFCPLLDKRFAELQALAQADADMAGRVKLVSVSFDPARDTPKTLAAHARRLGADVAMWRFVTAPEEQVDRFAATFGVNVIREADRTITHNLRTAIVGSDGRVVKVYDGTEWTAAQLGADLKAAR